jgi:hypothetical protein
MSVSIFETSSVAAATFGGQIDTESDLSLAMASSTEHAIGAESEAFLLDLAQKLDTRLVVGDHERVNTRQLVNLYDTLTHVDTEPLMRLGAAAVLGTVCSIHAKNRLHRRAMARGALNLLSTAMDPKLPSAAIAGTFALPLSYEPFTRTESGLYVSYAAELVGGATDTSEERSPSVPHQHMPELEERQSSPLDAVKIIELPQAVAASQFKDSFQFMSWINEAALPETLPLTYVSRDGKRCAAYVDLTELHPTLAGLKKDVAQNGQLGQAMRYVTDDIARLQCGEAVKRAPTDKTEIPLFVRGNAGSNENLLRTYFTRLNGLVHGLPVYGVVALVRTKGNQQKALRLVSRGNVSASQLQ